MDATRQALLVTLQHTSNVFLSEFGKAARPFKPSESAKIACKMNDEYAKAQAFEPAAKLSRRSHDKGDDEADSNAGGDNEAAAVSAIIDDVAAASAERKSKSETAIVAYKRREEEKAALPKVQSHALALRKRATMVDTPEWHAPWKLMRVISGHNGWVRSITVDPTNEWFATGANDRMIKIWDLASGQLKLTLTGHISAVRGLACSERHPYLFSAAEDKMVKCWDLETNKVVRHYHGHLSGVYCLTVHPTIDILITGGRDSVARVWDMRTRHAVHVLTGHKNTVMSVAAQAAEPQIISGSMDNFVKLWDLKAGKCHTTLTNHKKSIRALAIHPTEYVSIPNLLPLLPEHAQSTVVVKLAHAAISGKNCFHPYPHGFVESGHAVGTPSCRVAVITSRNGHAQTETL